MVRTKTPKPQSESKAEVTVQATTSTPVVKTKKTKASNETTTVAPVVTTPAVPETVVEETLETQLAEQSTEFLAKLQQIGTLISSLKTEYRTLEKKWSRELKVAQKLNTKRKRKSGNRAPSGFVKPTKISDELAKFLGKDTGSEMARTEVTRDINKYIRTNNLQDSSNGRKINADAKLAALLKLKKTDELTYFNLQRYMSPHFAKAVPKTVTSS